MYYLGIILAVLAGLFNGSFNIVLNEHGPAGLKIEYWRWENAWLIFTIFTIIINFIYTYAVLGPTKLHGVYSDAITNHTLDFIIVVIFCVFWGNGTIAFGLATKYLGMALGKCVCMSVYICVCLCMCLFVIVGVSKITRLYT